MSSLSEKIADTLLYTGVEASDITVSFLRSMLCSAPFDWAEVNVPIWRTQNCRKIVSLTKQSQLLITDLSSFSVFLRRIAPMRHMCHLEK